MTEPTLQEKREVLIQALEKLGKLEIQGGPPAGMTEQEVEEGYMEDCHGPNWRTIIANQHKETS